MKTGVQRSNYISLLFDLFRKIDYRDKENSGKKKLTGIIIGYIVSNTVLSFNFYSFFNEKSYIILTLTSNIFLIGIIVLNEFDTLFLAVKSYDFLITLPLRSRDIFISKFLSALIYLSSFIFACMLPQSIFFYFYEHDVFKTFLYAYVTFMFSFSIIVLLILIYLFILNVFKNKAHILLNLLQLLFFIFIFYSTTLSSRVKSRELPSVVKFDILSFEFVKYLPQNFYLEAVYNISYAIVCLVIMVLMISVLFIYMSGNYQKLLETVLSSGKVRKTRKKINFSFLGNFVKKYLLKDNYETASYELVKDQLKNSRFLRLKFIPFALMPLMMVIVGLISGIKELLFFNPSSSNPFLKTDLLMMSPSITMMIIMSSKLLVSSTKILDDNSSGTLWIYQNLPIPEKRLITKGANKFVFINLIIPVLLFILVSLSIAENFRIVLMNILFVSASVYFMLTVGSLFDKTYPFTLESTKFNSASKLLEILFSMLLGVVIFLIQIFVFQNIIFVILFVAIFFTVSILLNRK